MNSRSGGALIAVHGAASRARKAVEERNERIVAASAAGHSLRTIADAAGLSHTAISKILAR